MNTLEMYKILSDEDKSNLTIYCIYDGIYDAAKNENFEISDKVAMDIQEFAYELYLDDEFTNLPASQIAFFLTECYTKDEKFLDKVKDMDYDYILEAVENDNGDFYKDDEIER